MGSSRKGRQAEANAYVPLPLRDGVAPSYLWLTETVAGGMLRFLAERFPDVNEAAWARRLARPGGFVHVGKALGQEAQ
ncbi:MAG: pseudouridine synthase, partial [Lysobacteraceae bacterium]